MLPLTHIDLRYRAARAVNLGEYTGSAWRGAFGHALRRAVCITGQPECDGCPVRGTCTYAEIFETRPPAEEGFLSRYPDAPHPYVVIPGVETALAVGEASSMRMTLIGHSTRHAKTVAEALCRAVPQIGTAGELELLDCQIRPEDPTDASPIAPQAARILLDSPLRIRVQDRYWKPADFRFAPFFSTLLRRLTQLCAVHGKGAPDIDARALVAAASRIELRETQLRWQALHRYSSRQKRRIPMGGLHGSFEIRGDLDPLWPWLWAGQFLHVGKCTVMGLGRYRIEAVTANQDHLEATRTPAEPEQDLNQGSALTESTIEKDRSYIVAEHPKFRDCERWEFIDGVAFDLSGGPSLAHQRLSMELSSQIRTQLRGKVSQVFAAPFDVRFVLPDSADVVVQPDLMVVCDCKKITPRGIVGAPDWIVEILSPLTAGKDHVVKRSLYETQRVREYWLVHPVDRIVTVYRLGPDGKFGANEVVEAKGKLKVAALPDIEIDWALWEPMDAEPDEHGERM